MNNGKGRFQMDPYYARWQNGQENWCIYAIDWAAAFLVYDLTLPAWSRPRVAEALHRAIMNGYLRYPMRNRRIEWERRNAQVERDRFLRAGRLGLINRSRSRINIRYRQNVYHYGQCRSDRSM